MFKGILTHAAFGPFLGLGLVCLAATLWATVGVARALAPGVAALDPAWVGFLRAGLGAGLLLGATVVLRRPVPALRTWPFAALAVFGLAGAVFQISLFEAFARTGVTITVAVTVCLPPLIVALVLAVWHRRAPETGLLAALAIASVGMVLLAADSDGGMAVDGPGMAALVIASFAFAALALAARGVGMRLDPLPGTGIGLACTALLLGLLAGQGGVPVLAVPDVLMLGYIGFAATGLAYLAFVAGMRRTTSAGCGLAATMLEPLVAALLSAFLLHERLSVAAQIGCGLTLVALVVLFRTERRGSGQARRDEPIDKAA